VLGGATVRPRLAVCANREAGRKARRPLTGSRQSCSAHRRAEAVYRGPSRRGSAAATPCTTRDFPARGFWQLTGSRGVHRRDHVARPNASAGRRGSVRRRQSRRAASRRRSRRQQMAESSARTFAPFPRRHLASFATLFARATRTIPNGPYRPCYGRRVQVFGNAMGLCRALNNPMFRTAGGIGAPFRQDDTLSL